MQNGIQIAKIKLVLVVKITTLLLKCGGLSHTLAVLVNVKKKKLYSYTSSEGKQNQHITSPLHPVSTSHILVGFSQHGLETTMMIVVRQVKRGTVKPKDGTEQCTNSRKSKILVICLTVPIKEIIGMWLLAWSQHKQMYKTW